VFKLIGVGELADQVQASDPVVAALRAKAQRILPRAQRLAYAAGAKEFGDSLHIVEGRRPGTKSPHGYKRAFVQVVAGSDDAEAVEYGDGDVDRQAILRRALSA
jgi:hypothetical protein